MGAADDGLLLNFDLNVGPLISKPSYKGGRWKDRLIAKRGAAYRNKRPASGVNEVTSRYPTHSETRNGGQNTFRPNNTSEKPSNGLDPTDDIADRPSKRPRLGTTAITSSDLKSPKEVISSLFTSNPTSKPASTQSPTLLKAFPPSNAPLPSSTTNSFTALSLSPILASHLVTKFKLNAPTAIQSLALPHLLETDIDAFIRAETGSGKTLAYLLPIVQRILTLISSPPSSPTQSKKKLSRTSGLYALILAPTRDLARQIHSVLTQLLAPYPYLVCGAVLGGEKKKSEKARLRKGLNILVATPGRLVDHLEHTEVLDLSGVRWLVLDEGDRLMDMGFEEDVRRVVEALKGKEGGELQAGGKEGKGVEGLPSRRVTVLCSATMKDGVRKLGDMSLREAKMIALELGNAQKGGHRQREVETIQKHDDSYNDLDGEQGNDHRGLKAEKPDADAEVLSNKDGPRFQAPAQLQQSYIVSPPKQRLATLLALLKSTFSPQSNISPVRKILIFFSCADSVDFHFQVLANAPSPTSTSDEKDGETKKHNSSLTALAETIAPTLLLPRSPVVHRLHGSLSQPLRISTLSAFSSTTSPSVLLSTDVASRGLDLPDIDLVVEFDPPFSLDDHLHRVGRTARAGKAGQAVIFLMTGPEEAYVPLLEKTIGGGDGDSDGRLSGRTAEDILKDGFSSMASKAGRPPPRKTRGTSFSLSSDLAGTTPWGIAATDFQLSVERWVANNPKITELARKAYVSHVRAYATHVKDERSIFDVKALHLGHLAKAFGLRERPGRFGRGGSEGTKGKEGAGAGRKIVRGKRGAAAARDDEAGRGEVAVDAGEAKRKMRAMAKMQGAGASEFNLG